MNRKQLKNILLTTAACMAVSLTPTNIVHAAAVDVMAYEEFQPLAESSINHFMDQCDTITNYGTILDQEKMDAIKLQWASEHSETEHLKIWLERLTMRNMEGLSPRAINISSRFESFLANEPDLDCFKRLIEDLNGLLLSLEIF